MTEQLEPRELLASDLIISEFSASNDNVITDASGNSPDWIEVANIGDEPTDLGGHFLTDDVEDLTRWAFPSGTMISPGEHLVVFASGQNSPDPDGKLHTNFRLNADGEFVGLVSPERAIVSQFGGRDDDYSKQFTDISFGVGEYRLAETLAGHRTRAHVLIPTSDELQLDWTAPAFVPDASWMTGKGGVGYSTLGEGGVPVPGGSAVLRLDMNDARKGESGAEDVEKGWSAFQLDGNGAVYNGLRVTLSGVGDDVLLDDDDRSLPVDSPLGFTLDQVLDDFVYPQTLVDGEGLEVLVEGLVPGAEYEVTLWSMAAGSLGDRRSTWTEVSGGQAIPIDLDYSFLGTRQPISDTEFSMKALLTASGQGSLQIHGLRNGGASFGVYLNAIQIVVPSPVHLIQTNVQHEMHSQQSSVYVRLPFTAPSDTSYERLTLDMQYDAGFVAYLNGEEVARRNVSESTSVPLRFDAIAQSERTLEELLPSESIDISAFGHLISEGHNVLAIHGVNSAVDDEDFLIGAELIAENLESNAEVYFADPTPGRPNSGASFRGYVADTKFDVDRGFYDSPFDLTISSSTPGASIIYTTDGSKPSPENGTIVTLSETDAPKAIVPVSTTSYFRALAHKPGYLPTNVDTQTYIFLDDVIRQDPRFSLTDVTYPSIWQGRARADYAMDAEVVARWDDHNAINTDFGIRESLTSIPTMSIVMNHEDLWNSATGIYPQSTSTGSQFRKAASIEYVDPDTGETYQIDAGIQIHGGSSRDNGRLKKHSFRVLFTDDYGPSEMDFPLFPDTDNTQFNTLVLRACFTDAFGTRTVTDRYNPIESQYTRDVWMKDSLAAMGHLSTHNTYVHLYINGLYWGLYDPAERPDAAFLAQYDGGEREDWDVIKDFHQLAAGNVTAWNQMYSLARELPNSGNPDAIFHQLQGNDPDGTPNEELPNLLDMDNLIDYMILHIYAGAEDWPHHNWYAGRNRVDPGKGFRFFVWDQEITLDPRYHDLSDANSLSSPAELYDLLRRHSEAFRVRFADRVQQHLFAGGALSIEAGQARWMQRSNEIEKAIIGESARWGDEREGERHRLETGGQSVTVPLMTVDVWRDERDKVHDIYIPEAYRLFLERMTEIGLFPEVNAPQFNRQGGAVPTGFEVSMIAPQDPVLVETAVVPEFSAVKVLVPRDASLDSLDGITPPAWTIPSLDDSNWIAGTGGVGFDLQSDYAPVLGLDLLADSIPTEKGVDSDNDGAPDAISFYARFAFEIGPDADLDEFERLTLRMKYDDGFAAYLNGHLVATQNAPSVIAWNGNASRSHEPMIDTFEAFDISSFLPLLESDQTNVLAIHAFNIRVTSNDLLISPQLDLGDFEEVEYAPIYFTVDGTDPQLAGGGINGESAGLFDEAFPLSESTRVRARARVEGRWSAITEAAFTVTHADLNHDNLTNVDDLDLVCTGIRRGDPQSDLNADGVLDRADVEFMVRDFLHTVMGDVNADGTFDSEDFVHVLAAGEYEDAIQNNSTWSEGDWNCDGDFTSDDAVAALAAGPFGATAAPSALARDAAGALDGETAGQNAPKQVVKSFDLPSPDRRPRLKHVLTRDVLFSDPNARLAEDLFPVSAAHLTPHDLTEALFADFDHDPTVGRRP